MKDAQGDRRYSVIFVSTFFGGVGAVAAMLVAFFTGYFVIDISFLPEASCGRPGEYVYCFFDDDWDSGTYLSALTNFYSTVLTVLIALMALVAGLAYMAIRGSAFQRAEEVIEREVVRFFETDRGKISVSKGLQDFNIGYLNDRVDVIEVALEEAEIPFERVRLSDEKKTEKAD